MKRKTTLVLLSIVTFVIAINACRKAETFTNDELDERMSGGDATVFDASQGAFSQIIPGLSFRDAQVHGIGDKMFEAPFVTAPAPHYAGLGPVYNNHSCVSCHFGDGRGRPMETGEALQSMLIKIAVPGVDEFGAPAPVPGFGSQLQDKAIAGVQPEGSVNVVWTYHDVTLYDGTVVQLRKPDYSFINLYQPLPAGTVFSLRLAIPVFGMGLLEAIDEGSILAHADPNDANKDGISGRPNYVYDFVGHQPRKLGRIGWKATAPNIKTQVARALNQDMGVTTSVFPNKCVSGQSQMSGVFIQQPYDLHDTLLQALTFYCKTLAVPARRNTDDAMVKSGQQLFKNMGCVKCHVDVQTTAVDMSFPLLSNQVIRPYSDLLLHDMGPDLADNFPEYEASGSEWRTKPLWGLGLTQKVSNHTYLLHDGRARNVLEAILWHGGEAEQVKQRFMNLSKPNRDAVLKFLESL